MTFGKGAQRVTAVCSGIAFLSALVALALAVPEPTQFQYTVFRILLALASAAFAATIPGFLEVTVSGVARATGAIAVFLIVYLFSPAGVVADDPDKEAFLGPRTPQPFQASTEAPGVQADFGGTVVGGVGELTVKVERAAFSYPSAAPDGGGRFLPYYRVGIAVDEGQGWKVAYQSDRREVGRPLGVGESFSLEPATLTLALPGLASLAPHWLVFEVGVARTANESSPGTTYAHVHPGVLGDLAGLKPAERSAAHELLGHGRRFFAQLDPGQGPEQQGVSIRQITDASGELGSHG